MTLSKLDRRLRMKRRISKKISATADRPRMSVFRSNKQISVQLIDDAKGVTLISVSSLNKEIAEKEGLNKIKQAELVGELIAKKAIEKNIETVIFDRNGYLYHGRIKSLAEAARKAGIKF